MNSPLPFENCRVPCPAKMVIQELTIIQIRARGLSSLEIDVSLRYSAKHGAHKVPWLPLPPAMS